MLLASTASQAHLNHTTSSTTLHPSDHLQRTRTNLTRATSAVRSTDVIKSQPCRLYWRLRTPSAGLCVVAVGAAHILRASDDDSHHANRRIVA